MSNSRSIDVAAAVVSLLNSGPVQAGLSQAFTAVRAYRPLFDLTQHKAGLKVSVVPVSLDTDAFSRGKVRELVSVDVAVQNWVDPNSETAQCDALMWLVEQIKEVLEAPGALVLADAPTDCGWQGTSTDPLFEQDHLLHESVFTCVPTFAYLTRRAR
jgi:hypothetical protein